MKELSSQSKILCLAAPIESWDEAVPLGNGLMGGLLWGGGDTVKISLDRGDLWDLRMPAIFRQPDWTWKTVQELVRTRNGEQIAAMFDRPYSQDPYPTKIPAGRIELKFPGIETVEHFGLDMDSAVGRVEMRNGRVDVFYSAVKPVMVMRVTGRRPQLRLVPPPYSEPVKESDDARAPLGRRSLSRLGYPPPVKGKRGNLQWFLQEGACGFKYAVVVGARGSRMGHEMAVAIVTNEGAQDPVAEGVRLVNAALDRGYAAMFREHRRWWKKFWSRSQVGLPDLAVERYCNLVQYFYGSASRRGAPPIPLQGVWTADEDLIPPWRGDYHNDLNTQLTYWAYQAANRLESGLSFIDFIWGLLPAARDFARKFYGSPGAALPGVMALNGAPMGGWCMYSLSPTNGAWVSHSFYLHWRYTMDDAFLKSRAYPFCAEIGSCLEALLKPGADGLLRLPLSSSPEIHDNRLEAWLTPNSNFDLAIMRWLFEALAEMASALGDRGNARRWKSLYNRLPALAVGSVKGDPEGLPSGAFKLSPDEDLKESHRHLSHLMAIYPLGLIHMEGSDRDRSIILNSLHQLDNLGTSWWCGYSFAWAACMAARCGMGDRALLMLQLFLKGFILPNGFHVNGDYRDLGLSRFKYRPFTLEGNFAAAQAVHEMLLQGWGGVLRVFPAMPREWQNASFSRLRAEGAFIVSAERVNGSAVHVKVKAERAGLLRLRNPFGNAAVKWSRGGIRRSGRDLVVNLAPGEALEGRVRNGRA